MFNEYELPILINAIDEYTKIAKNVNPEQLTRIKSKLVSLLDGDTIEDGWSVEDVFSLMFDAEDDINRTPTPKELETARKVLKAAEDNHDATIGINWDVLQYHLDEIMETA